MKRCIRNSAKALIIKEGRPYKVYLGNEEAGDLECSE